MKGIVSKSQMEKVMLICPPRELQNQFATSLVQILQLRANQVKATEYIDSCFQLLLHRAFSGDLTAQWREARLPELLAEMEEQVRLLNQAPVQLSFDEVNSPC
jgi:type I restriction enzyme S subunit